MTYESDYKINFLSKTKKSRAINVIPFVNPSLYNLARSESSISLSLSQIKPNEQVVRLTYNIVLLLDESSAT